MKDSARQALLEKTFRAVSRRVVARLFVAQWFRLLSRSAAFVYPAAAVAAVCLWYFGDGWINAYWAAGLVLIWPALTGAWAWYCRPSAEAALARWDEDAGRDEMFISAYCFESQGQVDAGERLHLDRAARRLRKDVASLPRDLPISLARRAWALPMAFMVLVGLLLVESMPAEEPRLDEADRDRAREVAETLLEKAADAKLADKHQGLTAEEQEKLDKLEQSVNETAEKLRELGGETQRDVLAELEAKAHEAEELAEALDPAGAMELSSKMLEELARHADTADFAAAMQAKDLEKGSREALGLSKRLDHEDLSLQEQQRMERALQKSLAAATEADKQGLLGKHLNQAHRELAADKPKEAAEQFQRLSKQLDRANQRQAAQQQLQQLAQQLRNCGQQIFGRNPSKVRRLTADDPPGLQQLGAKQLEGLDDLPLMPLPQQLSATPQGPLGRPTLGAPLGSDQNPPDAMAEAPIPGSNARPAPPGSAMPMPGTGQIPIPGTGQCPGGQGQGSGQGQGQGQGQGPGEGAGFTPVPGTAPGQGGDGGNRAGHGLGAYRETRTNPLSPTATGTVNAAISGEGPAQLRQLEQSLHREEASRKSQALTIELIKTEEEALADEPLPLSRRRQVLRYFTALRRRLVEEPSPQSGP